eukprot:TRINITY_DN3_c0_g1_i1.p1 TRINITY_DN3_c0_g1~~TRINITY_DN3_c0_g1_i1.p1  ORF type:complete len:728 (-),score=202.87 TRINITY_DN3_c0_g1_i1:198-2174(-)
MSGDVLFGEDACTIRKDLLKRLSMVDHQMIGQVRARTLYEIGFCDLSKSDYVSALRRFETAFGELNAPSDEALMQNLQGAPFVLMKHAAKALKNHQVGEAGVALRRMTNIQARNWEADLKSVMKQHKIPKEGLPQVLPQIMKEKFAKDHHAVSDQVEKLLQALDSKIVTDNLDKDRQKRLAGVAGGSLAYLPALPMETLAQASVLPWVGKLADQIPKFVKEVDAAKLSKHASVMKRTKKGADCGSMPKLCEYLAKIPEVATNGFGESRLLVLKAGKTQKLDLCESNANLGVLMSLNAAVTVKVKAETAAIEVRNSLVFDLCSETRVSSETDGALVLLVQAWHPEVASIERTTFIRSIGASSWKLSEDDVKEVTKVVNAAAKKDWESNLKIWRAGSTLARTLSERLSAEETEKREEKRAAEKAEEAQQIDAQGKDAELKVVRDELERKRREKQDAKDAKINEKKRKQEAANQKLLEREPWRADYRVVEAKEKLWAAQEERRDANNKMEFDESTRLTKEVSKMERKVESATEKARKYYNKHGQVKVKDSSGTQDGDKPTSGSKEATSDLQVLLTKLEEDKMKAVDDENYKEATRLKKEIAALKAKMEEIGDSGSKAVASDLNAQLKQLEEDKRKAVADENYKEATRLKKEIIQLKARMEL